MEQRVLCSQKTFVGVFDHVNQSDLCLWGTCTHLSLLKYLSGIISSFLSFLENIIFSTDFLRQFDYVCGE